MCFTGTDDNLLSTTSKAKVEERGRSIAAGLSASRRDTTKPPHSAAWLVLETLRRVQALTAASSSVFAASAAAADRRRQSFSWKPILRGGGGNA